MKELFFDDDTFTADPKRARWRSRAGSAGSASRGRRTRAPTSTARRSQVLKDNGLRLFVVGYESGNEQILRNIRKGVERRARAALHPRLPRRRHPDPRHLHPRPPGRDAGDASRRRSASRRRCGRRRCRCRSRRRIRAPHFYDWVRENRYLTVDSLVDETGYQKCTVSYPEVSADEIFRAVETFYRRYYFSRRYIWKSIKKMARDRQEARGCSPRAGSSSARCGSAGRSPARGTRRSDPTLLILPSSLACAAFAVRLPAVPAGRGAALLPARRRAVDGRGAVPAAGHDPEAAQGPGPRSARQPRLPSAARTIPT